MLYLYPNKKNRQSYTAWGPRHFLRSALAVGFLNNSWVSSIFLSLTRAHKMHHLFHTHYGERKRERKRDREREHSYLGWNLNSLERGRSFSLSTVFLFSLFPPLWLSLHEISPIRYAKKGFPESWREGKKDRPFTVKLNTLYHAETLSWSSVTFLRWSQKIRGSGFQPNISSLII